MADLHEGVSVQIACGPENEWGRIGTEARLVWDSHIAASQVSVRPETSRGNETSDFLCSIPKTTHGAEVPPLLSGLLVHVSVAVSYGRWIAISLSPTPERYGGYQ